MLEDQDGNALMTPEQRATREKLLAKYMKKNEKKIVTWVKQNPGMKPPIYFDLEKNEFYWAGPTREQKKQVNKEKRRLTDEVTKHIDSHVPVGTVVRADGTKYSADPNAANNERKTPSFSIEGKVLNAEDFRRLKEKTRSQVTGTEEKNQDSEKDS